jgi:hypothetical protein
VIKRGFITLCLVCFKETKFQEFIFLIFSCLATIRKVNQRKVNYGQQKNCLYLQESVLLSLSKGKHFPLLIKHIFPLSVSLFENSWKAKKIWRITLTFQIFFPSNFSIISLYVFIFFVFFRSIRIIAKNPWSCLICCLFRKKLFLCICICCANNPSWLGKLPVNFFPIPSFLLHLLVTFKQAHRKTQPNSSQASHKKHNFSCTFGSFPNQSLPCFPVTGSRTKRETQTGGETAGGERDENWEWGADPWGLALLPLAPWICDVVLLLQRTGEWRERIEREQGKRKRAERELGMQEGKPNEGKPRGMRGMRGNQMTVEWEGNEGKWGETEWTGEW